MPPTPPRLLIVFDLDGTLVDSVRDLAGAASELAVSLGGRPLKTEEVAEMVGDGASLLVRRALIEAGVDPETPAALARFLDIYDRRLLDHTGPYPGAREALSMAATRARLAVLTNKPLEPSRKILSALGMLELFSEVIGGDGPLGRKPDPAGLLSLMVATPGVPALLVGDSPVDAETAEHAGCAFAFASYGFGARRFEKPPSTPYVLRRMSDLAAVLDRFAATASGT